MERLVPRTGGQLPACHRRASGCSAWERVPRRCVPRILVRGAKSSEMKIVRRYARFPCSAGPANFGRGNGNIRCIWPFQPRGGKATSGEAVEEDPDAEPEPEVEPDEDEDGAPTSASKSKKK